MFFVITKEQLRFVVPSSIRIPLSMTIEPIQFALKHFNFMIYSLRFISREPYEITEVRNPLTGIPIYICFLYCYILIFTLFTIFKETAENLKNVVFAVAEKILEFEDFKKEIEKKLIL